MSSTPISLLPEELLINIFEYLHGSKKHSNLINATLVCKKWNQIISQTLSLMDKLQLKLDSIMFKDTAALKDLKLTRLYRHVAWNNFSEPGKTPLKIYNEISSLEHLNTLKISHWKPTNTQLLKNIQKLSRCKFLQSLMFKDCYPTERYDREIEQIQRFEINSLRKFQLFNTSPSILNFIKCKELDRFTYSESRDVIFKFNVCHIVAFLNQLERCDDIALKFQQWNFGDDFKPRFLWNKLKLICEMDASAAISGMESFLEASTPNASAALKLSGFNFNKSTHNLFWLTILNNCKRITSLNFSSSRLPSDWTQLRNLPEVRKLRINANILEEVDRFSHFIRKLRNVTQLEMFSYVNNGFEHADLATDAASICQKFFNQITDLTLDSDVVDLQAWPQEYRNLRYHSISNMMWENLIAIRISVYNCIGSHINESFLRFCQRNPNLRQLIVFQKYQRDYISKLFNSEEKALIGWYNQLRATAIETCNVMVIQQRDRSAPMNWRHAGLDEIELFGRSLTEDENRFFI